MRITAITADGERDADVALRPRTTVADLAAALALDDCTRLSVDGTEVAADLRVDEIPLREGSRVCAPPAPVRSGSSVAADPGPTVVVCGGLHAGARLRLQPDSEIVMGRGRRADLRIRCRTLSVRHLAVGHRDDAGWYARDLGSRNGTRLDGRWLGHHPEPATPERPLDVAACRIRLEDASDDDLRPLGRPGADGRTPFNRPPRTASSPLPAPIPAPPAPTRLAGRSPFSWALFLAPVLVGVLLAVTVTPVLALVSLTGPVVTLASWLENRRRERRDDKRQARRFGRSLREFDAAVRAVRHDTEERLRTDNPDPAEIVRRSRGPARSLWERRPHHDDFLVVRIGSGEVPWVPPVDTSPTVDRPPSVDRVIAENQVLIDVPVTVDLRQDPCLGIAGPLTITSAIARAILCQLVTHQGPADVRVSLPTGGSAEEWRWAGWLPHTPSPSPRRDDEPGGSHVVVVDPASGAPAIRPDAPQGPGHTCQIVLADEADLLPSWCDTVVECIGADGLVRVHRPRVAETHERVLVDGVDAEVAEEVARALSRLHDPLTESTDALPDRVLLGALTGLEDPTAELVARRWATGETAPRAFIGVAPDGPFALDLVTHGPHGLIAGTTGSGKSELLRTLIVSLAATVPPSRLVFLLVDYKGGSAFDACADLPHTLGVVTDLDGGLGERCLRSLEAEIRRREQVLRHHGVGDVDELAASYDAVQEAAPLARLVVVVDEFASVARELPDFLQALVGIAERGRSLGIHLLLATQRPGGVVSESIRANTNLRISLRMLDRHEAADVLGQSDAASIPPGLPGRALVRVGPGEPSQVQVALAHEVPGRSEEPAPMLRWLDEPALDSPATMPDGYLRRLVQALREAGEQHQLPVAPWLPPLPTRIELDEVAEGTDHPTATHADAGAADLVVPLALADDPDNQRRVPWVWQPGSGNLLLYGLPGSGMTTTLRTACHSLAGAQGAAGLHAYVVGSSPELGHLADLPSVGAVVDPDETDRISRLSRVLESTTVPTVVLVDGVGRLLSALDRTGGMAAVGRWTRLVVEGPGRRCWFVLGAERVGAVPAAISSTARQRLVFRLADPYDYSALGLTPVDPRRLGVGRAIDAASGLEVQVALPGDPPTSEVERAGVEPPDPIAVLPGRVGLAPLLGGARSHGRRLQLPIGVTDGGRTVILELDAADHLLVAGPRGAGCSTALATLATAAAAADPHLPVIVTGTGRSPLRGLAPAGTRWIENDDLPAVLAELRSADDGWLLLVDDAELVDDPAGSLTDLIARPGSGGVIAAGWAEGLRSTFGHWTRGMRLARCGLALGAGALDADLWATELPARCITRPGRGWLLEHGRPREVQVAEP